MSRNILAFSASDALADAIDHEVARLTRASPLNPISRSSVIRRLIVAALDLDASDASLQPVAAPKRSRRVATVQSERT